MMPGNTIAMMRPAAGAPVGPFDPLTIPELINWYDPLLDAYTTGTVPVTDGTDIIDWRSQKAGGGTLFFYGGGTAPTWVADAGDGQPGTLWSNDHLATTGTGVSMGLGNQFAAFAIVKPFASWPVYSRVVSFGVGLDYNSYNGAVLIARDGSNVALQGYRNSAIKSTKAITTDVWMAVFSVWDGTNHTIYINNVGATPVSDPSNITAAQAYLYVGDIGGNGPWAGYMRDIMVFTGGDVTAHRTNLFNFAKSKYPGMGLP